MSTDIVLLLVLIFLGAFFAISEISVAAARKIKLQILLDEGNTRARDVLELQSNSGGFFAMIQIALNAIAILGGIVGEQSLTQFFKQLLAQVYQGALLDQLSFTLSFITITSLFILFADLVPKRIGMILPEVMAMKVIRPVRWITLLLTPLVMAFNAASTLLLRLLRLPTEREEHITSDDIVAMMDAGAEAGSIREQEYQIIENVFELDERTLTTVMTTREQIVFFDLDEASASIREKLIDHPHNWFLVCDGSLDKLVGVIESKEILRDVLKGGEPQLRPGLIDQAPLCMPDTLVISEGFNTFKESGKPFAVVLNEYGRVVGIVTVKDLLSSFMGNLIATAGDDQIVQRDEHSWLVDGATPLVDIARTLGLELEDFPNHSQYETAAGLLIFLLKRIPKRADSVTICGFKIEAVDIDNLRVDQLMITRIKSDLTN
ncbi:MAG: HlyC/CorC family transporter [Oceanospirillaceae bacterium]|nr:HlyC/CorC family transporter [Oceanospirillaceae bacterium]